MEFSVVERWHQNPDVEVFYDPAARKIAYKSLTFVYTQNVDDYRKNAYIDLSQYGTRLLGLSLSPGENLAALHRSESLLEVVLFQAEHTSVNLPCGKRNHILSYYWTPRSPFCDLVLVHTGGVILYRVRTIPTFGVDTVKSFAGPVDSCWFESRSEVLVVGKNTTKPGLANTFHLCYAKSIKKIEGSKLQLEAVTDKQRMCSGAESYMSAPVPRKEEDNHCCCLGRLYSAVYFAHFAVTDGSLRVYSIEPQSTALAFGPISLPGKSQCSMRMIDNLLIVQSFGTGEDFVFDFKTPACLQRPFCLVSHTSADTSPETSPMTLTRSLSNVLQTEKPLFAGLLSPDHDLFLDLEKGRCFKAHITPLEIVRNARNRLDATLFLMRRLGGKFDSLALLRRCLVEGADLDTICHFFDALRRVHFDISKDGIPVLRELANPRTEGSPRKMDPVDEAVLVRKAELSICGLYQREMCEIVFSGLCTSPDVSKRYSIALLLEFARSLLDEDLPLAPEMEILIVKSLISVGDFTTLQDSLERRLISPTKELCEMLATYWFLEPETIKPECVRIILIDTMHSLQLWDDLASFLYDENRLLEALICVDQSGREDLEKQFAEVSRDFI